MILGLTGGPGSGKSTVAKMFVNRGWKHWDIDVEALKLYVPNKKYICGLVLNDEDTWKDIDISLPHNFSDFKKAINEVVLNSDGKFRELESIFRSSLYTSLESAIYYTGFGNLLVDAAVLYEWSLDRYTNENILVDIKSDVQYNRLSQRGWDLYKISTIISKQMNPVKKRDMVDHVITNNTTTESLEKQVEKIDNLFVKLV